MAFVFADWVAAFPELATRGTPQQVAQLAAEAAIAFDLNRVADLDQRATLLNLVVAHLVELRLPGGGSPAAQGLVGRVTSASEGSVSVSLDAGQTKTLTEAWWTQTKYGAQFWMLTARYRMFRYIPGYLRRRPIINPVP